jgi:enamine deaminase RidA (YjgF/YER057c/UK114 family)
MATPVILEIVQRNGRTHASTGSPWEPRIGYSRAIRTGDTITVSGTVGVLPDGTYPKGGAAQARRAFDLIFAALEALGGKRTDVVRTRMFVTDIGEFDAIGAVHGELFREVRPAATMVEVSKLVDADARIEIEVDAIVV